MASQRNYTGLNYYEELLDALTKFELFRHVQEGDIRKMMAACDEVAVPAGEIICREGTAVSHIPFLLRGYAKVYTDAGRQRHIIDIVSKRRIVGLGSVFGPEKFDFTASALTDCQLYFFSPGSFRTLMSKNNLFTADLLSTVSIINSNRLRFRIMQGQKNVRGRIAGILLYFSDVLYQRKKFSFPLTRSELAHFSNTSTETAIRILSEFRQDNIICIDKREMEIVNHAMLRKISEKG